MKTSTVDLSERTMWPCTSTRIKRRRVDSVASLEQSLRDHLRLDLGRALEDREDAGVAQESRHRKFKRKAVATVDLHGIVGGRPGDTCGQELRHASLEVAAAAGILLPGREIGELPHHHDLGR